MLVLPWALALAFAPPLPGGGDTDDRDDSTAPAPADGAAPTEPAGPLRTVVIDDPDSGDGLDEQRGVDARHAGFATVVDLEHEVGARPADALAEVLSRSPGATVRSIGGLGQFSSVSLRGSTGQQVPIFLEGVPVGGDLAGLTNVGDLPLDTLDRVEVYRGHVPIRYGGAAIGGAIDLVGAGRPKRLGGFGALGVGSFGAREARAGTSAPLGEHVGVSARLGYAGAEGNFRFYDTGGTPQLFDDDTISRRRNNGFDRGLAQLRFDGDAGSGSRSWRWMAQELVVFKRAEIPGPATAQATETALRSGSARTIARVDRIGFAGPGGRLTWLGSLAVDRRTFSDPRGEVGLGVDDQRTATVDVFVSPRMRVPAWQGAFFSVNADARFQRASVDERGVAELEGVVSGDAIRRRGAFGISTELEQFAVERRLAIVPAVRVDGIDSHFAVPGGAGEQDDRGADTFTAAVSPRVAVRFRIIDGLSIRATGGRYFRPPSLLDLFGDRGYAVGNEGLKPEHGVSTDAGVVLDRKLGGVGVYGQAAAFMTRSEDLIQWIQAGPAVRPVNVADAVVAGVETAVQITFPRRALIVMSNYTFAHSVNLGPGAAFGQPLPGRPRHQAYARASVGRELWVRTGWVEPRVFGSVDALSENFDPSGRLDVPPRAIAGAGVELHVLRRLDLAFEVRNLFDRKVVAWTPPVGATDIALPSPISDFIGYPLPSRSAWVTVRLRL